MNTSKYLILSRTKMSKRLNSPTSRGMFSHLITITSPAQSRYPSGIGHYPYRLQLCFEDTDDPSHFDAPSVRDMERIIAYCQSCLNAGGNMLINCEAGISRSTAAGLIFLYLLHDRNAEVAMTQLRLSNPNAHPNTLMITLADDLLGCEGALLGALMRSS